MKSYALILFLSLNVSVWGQFKINEPKPFSFTDNVDSFRFNLSKFCIGYSTSNSQIQIDIRIYRFQAFGDNKLIRIFGKDEHSLAIDVYSVLSYKDSMIFYKEFYGSGISSAIRDLFAKFDPLNLPSLDYGYITAREMPRVNDGNYYWVETKVDGTFSLQEFDNPEIYAKHFSEELTQAKPFTEFIMNIEKLTGTNIIEPDIPGKFIDIRYEPDFGAVQAPKIFP